MVVELLIEAAFVGFLAWTWFGARPTIERFAASHGLAIDSSSRPTVERALRRSYRGRVLGALAGAVALGGLALVFGVALGAVGALVGLIAGSMVGIALAQHRPRADTGAVRQASLAARTVAGYAPAHAVASIAFTTLLCLALPALAILVAPAGLGPYGAGIVAAVSAVLIVPVGFVLQRRIVEAPRDTLAAPVDDALRTAAVRSVHHAMLGVLLCGITVAGFIGAVVQNPMTVVDDRGTVFTAPPGSTSLSIDTGRIQAGEPDAPVRVYWTEADGSEHHTRWLAVDGPPRLGDDDDVFAVQAFGWTMVFAAFGALRNWWRAATSWRRATRGPAPVAAADPAGAAP
jgi:hypothetical protein